MARRKRRGRRGGKGNRSAQPQVVHPEAAGVDVGATMVYAAVRAERAEQPIQSFPTFTRDLHALADWLSACQVTTVAMESTGVYWIPVLSDPGSTRLRGGAGQRPPRALGARSQERRRRLRMAAVSALGRVSARLVPTA